MNLLKSGLVQINPELMTMHALTYDIERYKRGPQNITCLAKTPINIPHLSHILKDVPELLLSSRQQPASGL